MKEDIRKVLMKKLQGKEHCCAECRQYWEEDEKCGCTAKKKALRNEPN